MYTEDVVLVLAHMISVRSTIGLSQEGVAPLRGHSVKLVSGTIRERTQTRVGGSCFGLVFHRGEQSSVNSDECYFTNRCVNKKHSYRLTTGYLG